MNLKTFVKLTNVVAVVSILLLIYWVFIFVSSEVFGFKIFRENITQTFAMSVLGILALMGGSLMINVMFNLTRIAQKHNQDEVAEAKKLSKHLILAFALSFPVIFGFLFVGDFMTSKKKENMLVSSARSIVESNPEKSDRLTQYEFSDPWLASTAETLNFFEKTERNFPHVSLVVRDSLDGRPVYLGFNDYATARNDKGEIIQPERKQYLIRTTLDERDYLERVFSGSTTENSFSASDGNYKLYYPFARDGKIVIFMFSDHQQYGKMGS
jgi:hypothetical protein